MGHYYSEMYSDDRTPEQKKEDANKQKRHKQLEKHLCDVFKCKRGELKIVHEILKESCIRNGCKLTTLGFGNMDWIYMEI